MRTKLDVQIDISEIGYRRFLKYQLIPVFKILEIGDPFEDFTGPNYEEYAEALKIQDLYNQFIGSLTKEEKETVNYLRYHNPNERSPLFYYRDFQITYKKWKQIFFKKYDPSLCDISAYRLGLLMKKIRTFHKISKASLARRLGVDDSCVCLYEKGKRLPNLNYAKKFCNIFSISIDDLLSFSLNTSLK